MRRFGTLVAVVLGLACASPVVHAAETLLWLDGEGALIRNLENVAVEPGTGLQTDDTLRVDVGGRLKALLGDAVLQLWDDSEVRLERLDHDRIALELIGGRLRIVVDPELPAPPRIAVRTPAARITLEGGGDVVVQHDRSGDYTEVAALAGHPVVEHLFEDFPGTVTLDPQQSSLVTLESPPSAPVLMGREAWRELVASLAWTLPRPVPDWSERRTALLDTLAEDAFGRLRRETARPLVPTHLVVEGLGWRHTAEPPAPREPEPRGTVEVRWQLEEGAP